MQGLGGRTALVSEIGRASLRRSAEEGANVVVAELEEMAGAVAPDRWA